MIKNISFRVSKQPPAAPVPIQLPEPEPVENEVNGGVIFMPIRDVADFYLLAMILTGSPLAEPENDDE